MLTFMLMLLLTFMHMLMLILMLLFFKLEKGMLTFFAVCAISQFSRCSAVGRLICVRVRVGLYVSLCCETVLANDIVSRLRHALR